MAIIGLCGYKGSGKSTVAEYLAKEHGFKRVNFKDGLVAEVKEKFPDVLRQLTKVYYGDTPSYVGTKSGVEKLFSEKPAAMRALLQNYGTEVRRGDDPNYWVDRWRTTVAQIEGNIVVDDVRFFNEMAVVADHNGVLIRVTRPDITTGGLHQSETEQESFISDFTIAGVPGSHTEIFKQVDEIIRTLKENVD